MTEDHSDYKIGARDLGSQHVWQAKETRIAQLFKVSKLAQTLIPSPELNSISRLKKKTSH